MIDLTVNGLRGCVNSIDMTLQPAVLQSGDSLAREQLALLRKYLDFSAQRARLLHGRARFELEHDGTLAQAVSEALGGPEGDARQADSLLAMHREARSRLADPAATLACLEELSARIRSAVSRVVRTLPQHQTACRRAVDQAVVAHARPLIRFQRSWYAPQGWESDPQALPSVESWLSPQAQS